MSDPIQNKENPEEVDLGQVFKAVGNAFGRLFNFIWYILKGLFDLLVLLLLFIRRHFLKFAVAAVIGAAVGYFLDTRREVIYQGNLIVQPNFGSAQQLYQNISYYNTLIHQGDTLLLARTFGITPEEAASLRAFYMRPLEDENSTLEAYNKFLRKIEDTTLLKKYTYDYFKENISAYDYTVHTIGVTALRNNIFKHLQPVIIASVTENSYFNTKKQITLENLNRNDSILKNSISEIDSLRRVYMEVLLAESKRENPQGGTSIVLSEKNVRTNELELFNTKIRFKDDLNDNEIERSENSEVINIISNFQPVGYKVNVIYRRYYFMFGAAAILLMLLYILLRELNTFLNSYERKRKV